MKEPGSFQPVSYTHLMRYASFPLMRLDKAFGIPGQHGFELLLGVLIQIAGGADGVHPVSYTHLDVYKRQVYDYSNHNRSNEVQHIEPAPVLIVEGILPFVEPEPVSYTHLIPGGKALNSLAAERLAKLIKLRMPEY